LRVGLLAACREPNRRCGCGGTGARTAAESDDAWARWYVRRGLVGVALGRGMRCDAGSPCGARLLECGPCAVANRRWRAASAPMMGWGSWLRVGLLAACREPNRSCGCGGAGARTAAESDDADSRRYVRRGLVGVALGRGMRCDAGSPCGARLLVCGPCAVANRRWRAASAHMMGWGSWLRVGLLAACRERHRRCGCGGTGARTAARTAAESDDA
jgi:hypothetical protein